MLSLIFKYPLPLVWCGEVVTEEAQSVALEFAHTHRVLAAGCRGATAFGSMTSLPRRNLRDIENIVP